MPRDISDIFGPLLSDFGLVNAPGFFLLSGVTLGDSTLWPVEMYFYAMSSFPVETHI